MTSTDAEKLSCLLKLAFGNDRAHYDRFCEIVRSTVPEAHAAVLRGSAITGTRYADGAPFDADGPGTSDLDLTLVGGEVVGWFDPEEFYIPGVHSKPLSDEHPNAAPALVPLRDQLTLMVGRPVNIQATKDWIMFLREHLMGQPYLTLIGKLDDL